MIRVKVQGLISVVRFSLNAAGQGWSLSYTDYPEKETHGLILFSSWTW